MRRWRGAARGLGFLLLWAAPGTTGLYWWALA